jgi:hypothetical protein
MFCNSMAGGSGLPDARGDGVYCRGGHVWYSPSSSSEVWLIFRYLSQAQSVLLSFALDFDLLPTPGILLYSKDYGGWRFSDIFGRICN